LETKFIIKQFVLFDAMMVYCFIKNLWYQYIFINYTFHRISKKTACRELIYELV